MQEVPAAISKTDEKVDLLSATAWSSGSVDGDVFAGFLEYQANKVTDAADSSAMAAPAVSDSTPQTDIHDDQPATTAAHVAEQAVHRARERETPQPEHTRIRQAAKEASASAKDAANDMEEVLEADDKLKSMKDVKVDAESFQAMKPQLEKYGLSKEDVEALEKKVGSEAGITWGNLVSFISSRMASENQVTELSPGQRQKLMTFFQKLGLSAPEAQRMVSDLAAGKTDQVLSAVERQLKELPQDKLATLDKEEIEAFLEQLKQIKGDAQTKELGLARVVGKAMENAMDKARRMAHIEVQDKLGAQEHKARGLTVASKNVVDQASDQIEANIHRISTLDQETPVAEQTRRAEREAAKLVKNLSEGDQLKVAVNKTEANIHKGLKLGDNKHHADLLAQQDDQTADDKAWNEFFGKLKVDEQSLGKGFESRLDNVKGLSEALSQAKSERSAAKPWERTTAPRAIRQVEDAVLKNLTGGAKRLTIQLRPEHLGQLSVALTVKNSEISATIRADNHETAHILADQLHALRQSLEAQGLKVAKVEVQTQLSGGDQSGWQGLAQQGKNFEEQMRNGMGSRFGRGFGMDAEGMARDMNNIAREAILSGNGNGLHLIA